MIRKRERTELRVDVFPWRGDGRTTEHRTHLRAELTGLNAVDGVFIGPGSPYDDETAVWEIVGNARQRGVPLVGT